MLVAGSLIVGAACEKLAPPAAGRSEVVQAGPPVAPPPAVRHDERVFAGGIPPVAITFANPTAGGSSQVAEGAKLFIAMNCDGCHGDGATGWVGPSLSSRRWRYGGADAALFESIYFGRPHGMPAFGGLLSQEMTWKLVSYIKALPPPATMPTRSW